MNSTTLICKRCKAPLEYEEGSAILHCPHCGYTEKLDESDPITIERIRAKAYKDTELGKTQIEKEAHLEEKKLNIEEKLLGFKKAKIIIFAAIALVIIGLIGYAIYGIQHKGKVHIKQSSDYYIGADYQVAHRLLEEAGFVRIDDSPQATLSKKEQELVGKVTQVSIGGNPAFEEGWFAKDSSVTIYYGVLDPQKENDIRIPLSYTDCIGKDHQSIEDMLSAEGFSNIKAVPSYELGMDKQSEDGKIKKITVNNSAAFSSGDYFAADSIIQIDYFAIIPERKSDVMIPEGSDSFAERDYLDACETFRNAGFTNITLIPKEVKLFDGAKSGTVQSVKVGDKSTFIQGTWLPNETEVKITYGAKTFKYEGKDYEEIVKELTSMGFSDISCEALHDLSTKEAKKANEVVSVLIGGEEFAEAKEWNLLSPIIIKYHSAQQAGSGQISMAKSSKDLTGENYETVILALQEMGFTNVKSAPLGDLKKGWLHKEGEVDKVSIGGITKFSVNDIFDADAEVIITYHSFPA